MTDRSTDNPEDQPVPFEPDAPPAADQTALIEDISPEQEAIAEAAAASGVNVPAELPEAPELVEAEATDDGDDVVDDAETDAEEAGGEAASDLDAEELEAAASAAEADETAETQDVGDVDRPPVPAGVAARRAAKAPTSARAGGRTALEVDPALRIRDRASQVFVALTVIVFVAIFANAMLFGVGGALNAAPSPSPSGSPTSSGSPAASGSTAPTGSTAPATTAPAAPGPTFTAGPSAS